MVYALGVIVPNLTMCYILFRMLDGVFERKYSGKFYWIAYVSMAVFQCAVTFLRIPFLSLATFTLILALLVKTSYISTNNKAIYGMLFLVYLALIDMVIVPLFARLTNTTVKQTMGNDMDYFITGILGAIIGLCSYRLVLRVLMRHRVKILTRGQEIFIAFLGCFELGVIHAISRLRDYGTKEVNLIVVGISLGFLVVDAYVITLFEHVSDKNELQMQARLWEQQMLMDERYFKQIEIQNEKYRKIMHDIKKHILIMKKMNQADNTYCDEVLELISWQGMKFKCSNPVLGRVLNDRLLICEDKGISAELAVDDVDLSFMRKSDITTILMNLLDNAIEACEETESKRLQIKIKEIQKNIVVVIKNSCKEDALIPDKIGVSAKPGHMGIGLSNVRMALAGYGAELELELEDQMFVSKFIIKIK